MKYRTSASIHLLALISFVLSLWCNAVWLLPPRAMLVIEQHLVHILIGGVYASLFSIPYFFEYIMPGLPLADDADSLLSLPLAWWTRQMVRLLGFLFPAPCLMLGWLSFKQAVHAASSSLPFGLSLVVGGFAVYHAFLMAKNMTTTEHVHQHSFNQQPMVQTMTRSTGTVCSRLYN
ncbi:unnamed protein product [Protopolystoma xenopodis]|uniref:Uncharacterized protein n=1 Tax=Protopolystoma xenopodis TaxID=117903 RepID=A0A448X2F9_9PLAT|nr:unnamed protein product [Protopolystoma xenopodis]